MSAQSRLSTCPCCHTPLSDPFYSVGPVPVHSCLLVPRRAEALAFPTDNIRLSVCDNCGFVTNVNFDPKWSAYAPAYEDQQSFSPTFNTFANKMANDLIDRYALQGRAVVEVGCSKGDFLRLLCEAGGMHAVGIDPNISPGRVAPPDRGSLDFVAGYYGPQHFDLSADLLCCRHTMEHIQDISGTFALFRKHAEANPGCILVIEVPDAMRIWAEAAFEDIYYEHCSYFTAGSLARALRAAGFAITDLRREYGDQYLVVEASLDPEKGRRFDIEEEPEKVVQAIRAMQQPLERKLTYWRRTFNDANTPIAIWGSGSKCVSFLRTLEATKAVCAIVDINPHRKGRYAPGLGLPIDTPERLQQAKPEKIVIMNSIYFDEIAADLTKMGVPAEILTLEDAGL